MITVIAILVTVPFFIIMLSVRHLMGVTLCHRTVELRGVDELPAHFSSAFSEALRSLEKLGFRASHCEVSGVLFGPSDFKTWILVCVNDEQKVAASIFAPTQLNLRTPADISLFSLDRSRETFTSFMCKAHLFVPGMERFTVHDTYTSSIEEMFRKHLAARVEKVADPIMLDPEERIAEAQLFIDRYLDFLHRGGWTRSLEPGQYQFRFLPAFRFAARQLIGSTKAAMLNRFDRSTQTTAAPVAPAEFEIDVFQRFDMSVAETRPMAWPVKLGLLLVSVFAFSGVFGFALSMSLDRALLFAAVILVHEFGHVLGMWVFGYRDLQVLFLPALGAITLGNKSNAEPYQRAIVLLLGPSPGLIGGWVLLFKAESVDTLTGQLAVIAIALNYLNLLPFKPLDGGQLLETLVLQRFPYVSSIATFISGLAFALAGWFAHDIVLTAAGAIIIFVSRSQWILSHARKALKNVDGDRSDTLRSIFTELQNSRYNRLTLATKVRFARSILSQRESGEVSARLATACLAAQVSGLIIPVVLFFYYTRTA